MSVSRSYMCVSYISRNKLYCKII